MGLAVIPRREPARTIALVAYGLTLRAGAVEHFLGEAGSERTSRSLAALAFHAAALRRYSAHAVERLAAIRGGNITHWDGGS